MAVITISRQEGSGGDEVAAHVASILKYHLVKRAYLEKAVYEYCLLKTIKQPPLPEIIPPSVNKPGSRVAHRQVLRAVLMNLAARENLVLAGYGGQVIFHGFKSAFHVRVVAPFEDRVRCYSAAQSVGKDEASEQIRKRDLERQAFIKEFFGAQIGKQHYYDLILNMSRLSVAKGAEIIASAFHAALQENEEGVEEFQRHMEHNQVERIDLIPDHYQGNELSTVTIFAHQSEEEFARVLTFYRIRWEYEPRSFPIRHDEQGQVIESFTPDFYLPEFETYIELTTMKQDLVTKKNRKIKKFRELHPDVKLKVFYGRDYKQLLGKYGMD